MPATHHGPRHPAPGTNLPVNSSRYNKPRRPYGEPVAYEKSYPRFISPPVTNNTNLVLPLHAILRNPQEEADIKKAGKLVFHCVGDTGGIKGEEAQEAVSHAMEHQIQQATSDADRPRFFYHLGDVVYYNGLRHLYESQFYDPYKYYPAPIVAIPGNHDGDTHTQAHDEPDTEGSLAGFIDNFCAPQAEHVNSYRELMTQPYVYWTLDTPVATIVGLYSNVDGSLDGKGAYEQQSFFEQQVAAAPKDKALLVAVHHPPYSLDAPHGGSPRILESVERAADRGGRWPDAVFSGHVHNYQRFTREIGGGGGGARQIPFMVAGCGGYADNPKSIHKLQLDANGKTFPHGKRVATTHKDVFLEFYEQTNPGFMRVTVDRKTLKVEYFIVPFDDAPPADAVDTMTLDLATHRLV